MGIVKSLRIGISIGSVLLLPLISMAKEQACVTGPPTAASYTWNFTREASGLLRDMHDDAARASRAAEVLQTAAQNPDESWASRAYQLSSIRAEVDDMGKRLCRLEAIRRVAAPWQQQAIDQIAPLVQYMADNTDDAIHYLNTHQAAYWTPAYRTYSGKLYAEATALRRQIHFDRSAAIQSEFWRIRASRQPLARPPFTAMASWAERAMPGRMESHGAGYGPSIATG